MDQRSLWEEGIQVRKLLFLRKKDFKFLEGLKDKFLRRARNFWKSEKRGVKRSYRKTVARRSKEEKGLRVGGFSGKVSGVVDEAKWTEFWSWRRVIENEWVKTYEERYEKKVKEIKT